MRTTAPSRFKRALRMTKRSGECPLRALGSTRLCAQYPRIARVSPVRGRSLADDDGRPLAHFTPDVDAVPPFGHRRIGPAKDDASVDGRQVHAAVAPRDAEHVV